jgi:hypothetical protein
MVNQVVPIRIRRIIFLVDKTLVSHFKILNHEAWRSKVEINVDIEFDQEKFLQNLFFFNSQQQKKSYKLQIKKKLRKYNSLQKLQPKSFISIESSSNHTSVF